MDSGSKRNNKKASKIYDNSNFKSLPAKVKLVVLRKLHLNRSKNVEKQEYFQRKQTEFG